MRLILQEATDQELLNRLKKIPKYANNKKVNLALVSKLARLDPDTASKSDGRIIRVGGNTEKLLKLSLAGDPFLLRKLKTSAGKEDLKQTLTQYMRFKKELKSFGYSGLIQDCSSFEEIQNQVQLVLATRQEKVPSKESGENTNIVIWAENDEWQVASPLNRAGAQYLGRDTTWCTARKDTSHYYSIYNTNGRLFVFTNRSTGEKYQYCNGDLEGSDSPSLANRKNQDMGDLNTWAEDNDIPKDWVLAVQSASFSSAGRDGEWYSKLEDQKALRTELYGEERERDPAQVALQKAMNTIIATDWRVLRKKLQSDAFFERWAKSTSIFVCYSNSCYASIWDLLIAFPESDSWFRVPLGEWANELVREELEEKAERGSYAYEMWHACYQAIVSRDKRKLTEELTQFNDAEIAVGWAHVAAIKKKIRSIMASSSSFVQVRETLPRWVYEDANLMLKDFRILCKRNLGRNWLERARARRDFQLSKEEEDVLTFLEEEYDYPGSIPKVEAFLDAVTDFIFSESPVDRWEEDILPRILGETEKEIFRDIQRFQKLPLVVTKELVKLGVLSDASSREEILQLPLVVIWLGNELEYLEGNMERYKSEGIPFNTDDWSPRKDGWALANALNLFPLMCEPDGAAAFYPSLGPGWRINSWVMSSVCSPYNDKFPYKIKWMLAGRGCNNSFWDSAEVVIRQGLEAKKRGEQNVYAAALERFGVAVKGEYLTFNSKELFEPVLEFITKILYLVWYLSGARSFYIQLHGLKKKELSPDDPAYDDWVNEVDRVTALVQENLDAVCKQIFDSAWRLRLVASKPSETHAGAVLSSTGKIPDGIAVHLAFSLLVKGGCELGDIVKGLAATEVTADESVLPYTRGMDAYFKQLILRWKDRLYAGADTYEDTSFQEYVSSFALLEEDSNNLACELARLLYDRVGFEEFSSVVAKLNEGLKYSVISKGEK